MYDLTRHFEEQWRARVADTAPSAHLVSMMIADSVKLQEYRRAMTPRGRSLTVLALYWHVEQGMVFKVDEYDKRVVTVITAKTKTEQTGLTG